MKSPSIQPLLTDFCSLLTQNATLCNLLQTIIHKEEEQLAVDCLKLIHSSVHMIHSQLSFKFNILAEQPEGPLPIPIISLHTRLWHQLSFPHSTEVCQLTHETIIHVEEVIQLLLPSLQSIIFSRPKSTSTPSISEQIIHRPIQILDPYISALHSNYYYPLATEERMMLEDMQMQRYSPRQSPTRATPPATVPITVESSIQAITELIKEVEADDPPTESSMAPPIMEPEKKNTFNHRFAIYHKQTYPTPGAPPTQLALIKSFVKSIKSADNQAKILPIRSNLNIYSLSTTDQITL